jgi:hypothetical protein
VRRAAGERRFPIRQRRDVQHRFRPQLLQASDGPIPPYFAFHREKVCSLIPYPAADLRRRRAVLLLTQYADESALAEPGSSPRPSPVDGLSYQARDLPGEEVAVATPFAEASSPFCARYTAGHYDSLFEERQTMAR